MQVMMTNY